MDLILDINYSQKNKNITTQIQEAEKKGVPVWSCNHYALRASVREKNQQALLYLKEKYIREKREDEFKALVRDFMKNG